MNLDTFKKKYGPLPLWAWSAIAAVVLFGAYLYFRKRNAAKSSANQTPADATSGNGSGNDFVPPLIPDGGGGGGASPNPEPTTVVGTTPPGPTTQTPPPQPVAAPPTTTPTPGATSSPTKTGGYAEPAPIVNPNSSVPAAVQLQATVAKPTASGVFPKSPTPQAVKITANKTGGSANKTQGVFAVH